MRKFIDWSTLDLKGKHSGTMKIKCPECNSNRTNKADRSLSVNVSTGLAKCHYCEAISVRDKQQETERKFTLPAQTWRNYTTLSDKMVKYCEGRKIQQFTLNEAGVTEELFYQPKSQKEVNNIVFNYFEGELLVNKKYRSGDKGFTQSKDGKPIFYNINSAIGSDELYIVEGEFDALALMQIGIKNVVSVPNGANDNDNYWINSESYLKDVKRFYIATDNDTKGNDLAEKIAQRLGRYRCERVNFTGKDANEDLISGVLEKSLKNTSRYPIGGTFTSMDLKDSMLDFYANGLPPTLEIKNPNFKRCNEIYREMLGQLVVCTGIPSHGKSNFTEWRVLNYLLENDFKASFFSPEHQPMALHMTSFAEKVIGKSYFFEPRITPEEIDQFTEWADQKIYLTSTEMGQTPDWDWLIAKFTEQLYAYGVNIFVVDAFNKVLLGKTNNKKDAIDEVLTRLTNFAQMNNVLLILVAHPTKMNKEGAAQKMPELYDVSGSSDFRNQTHCGYVVHRVFADGDDWTVFKNLKTKYKFQGTIGSEVEFRYHLPSGRYYDKFMKPQTENLLGESQSKRMPKSNLFNHSKEFEDIINGETDIIIPF